MKTNKTISRRTFLKLASLSTAFSLTACEQSMDAKTSATPKWSNPNIILFLADDLGYGDLQCNVPSSKVPTSNLNKLSSQGVRFTDAHTPSSVCSPTRYGLLTGRYCWRTYLKSGVLGPYSSPLIEPDRLTIPKMLKAKDYNTACIGKWHLGMQWTTHNNAPLPKFWDHKHDQSQVDLSKPITAGPLTAGFDYYFGTNVPNFPPYCFIENDRTIGIPTEQKPDNVYGNPGRMLDGWKLEDILPKLTEKAVDYIDEKSKSDKPFFLYFGSTAPHTPIVPAKQFHGKSNAGPYGDLVHQVDYTVGQIMKALDKNNIADNTIIIFTSDNGSPGRAGDPHVHGKDFQPTGSVITKYGHNPNHPWKGMKSDVYEGGHHVPFIVRWPGKTKPSTTSAEPLCLTDVMASLASILNYNLPKEAAPDSYDISPAILGKPVGIDAGKDPIRPAIVHHSGSGIFAIRRGRWKLITILGSGGWTKPARVKPTPGGPTGQLYDLYADPTETINLWNDHPDIVKQLTDLLEKYKTQGHS